MKKMKTLVIERPGKILWKEKDIPLPQKGEALLRIKYCGICGSDVAVFNGNQPFASYPRIPGHEFSAEIVHIEGEQGKLKNGMQVTANPYFNCKECYPCKRGKVNCCENNQTMGVQREGAFAEYVVMPVEKIINGNGLPLQELAVVEPFSISYHAINRSEVQPNDNVLVIGAGPIGIFAMIAAKLRGANVYIADLFDKRLELAKNIGADTVINSNNHDLCATIRELTDNNGVDVCVDAVGSERAFKSCIENTCFGGKIILIGNGKKETTFNHSILVKKEISLYGSRNSLNDFEPIIRLISSKYINISSAITHVYKMYQAEEAFLALVENDGSKTKVLIEF